MSVQLIMAAIAVRRAQGLSLRAYGAEGFTAEVPFTCHAKDVEQRERWRAQMVAKGFTVEVMETDAPSNACVFCFADGPRYAGVSLGSTWNGFDNVAVTPEVRDVIVADIRAEMGADDETAAELAALVPGADGLISLANGYASEIVQPEEA